MVTELPFVLRGHPYAARTHVFSERPFFTQKCVYAGKVYSHRPLNPLLESTGWRRLGHLALHLTKKQNASRAVEPGAPTCALNALMCARSVSPDDGLYVEVEGIARHVRLLIINAQ
jgi:hypothetical protein